MEAFSLIIAQYHGTPPTEFVFGDPKLCSFKPESIRARDRAHAEEIAQKIERETIPECQQYLRIVPKDSSEMRVRVWVQ